MKRYLVIVFLSAWFVYFSVSDYKKSKQYDEYIEQKETEYQTKRDSLTNLISDIQKEKSMIAQKLDSIENSYKEQIVVVRKMTKNESIDFFLNATR